MGKVVHKIILEKLLETKEIEYTSTQRWINWIMSWIYWSISWIYKPKIKPVPSPIDLNEGYDFVLQKQMKMERFPDYSGSGFVENTSPAGTPEQLKLWTWHDLENIKTSKE